MKDATSSRDSSASRGSEEGSDSGKMPPMCCLLVEEFEHFLLQTTKINHIRAPDIVIEPTNKINWLKKPV